MCIKPTLQPLTKVHQRDGHTADVTQQRLIWADASVYDCTDVQDAAVRGFNGR